MPRFLSFSSGSSGNCYYVGNEENGFIIDMGVSGRTLKKACQTNGIDLKTVSMILVSHDHGDHIKYLGPVAERMSVPVFATSKLHQSMETHPCTRGCLSGCRRVIRNDVPVEHRGIKFVSFYVPHDATDTVGYFIDFYGTKLVFMTDLGSVPEHALEYCRKADYVIIESNYDREMLLGGPYPAVLKSRIVAGFGHLSNAQCASAIKSICHEGLKAIFLCHLSDNNNTPELAYRSAHEALTSIGLVPGEDIQLHCLPRKEVSQVFELL